MLRAEEYPVDSKRRTFLIILAGVGWALELSIMAASVAAMEFVDAYSFFFGRLFALVGFLASVLTLGLWVEKIRNRQMLPVEWQALPVEDVYRMGIKVGANIAQSCPPPPTPDVQSLLEAFKDHPINGTGPQESPPVFYQRRDQ